MRSTNGAISGSARRAAPTPPPTSALVADTRFSHDRGFYDAPFYVTLTTATPDATIYYTLDGSYPFDEERGIPAGSLYTEPIFISRTTCLRAIALKPGWKATNVDTQTYLFLDDVIRQPASPFDWPTDWGHTGHGDYEMDPDVVDDPLYSETIKDDMKAVPTLSLVTHKDYWFGEQRQGHLSGRRVERAARLGRTDLRRRPQGGSRPTAP